MTGKQTKSRRAFHALLDTLKEVDLEYLSEKRGITNANDIAEGERWLTQILRLGFSFHVENDPQAPRFVPMLGPTIKFQGDNSDHASYYAPLDGSRSYRIRGKLTGEVYLAFTTYGTKEPGGYPNQVVSHLSFDQMEIEPDGSYEITLSATPQAGNWLQLTEDVTGMQTRHYYQNLVSVLADPDLNPVVRIEALDSVTPPTPYDDATLAHKFSMLRNFVRSNTVDLPIQKPESVPTWFSLVPHVFPKPEIWTNSDGGGFGAVDNAYSACPFVLEEDQALVIEGKLPSCVFANVCLWNRFLQTFDYRFRKISLNRAQMELDAEDRFRIIVSRRDPGVRNWLDTEGRRTGTIYWRFLMPKGEIEPITAKLVAFDEVCVRSS